MSLFNKNDDNQNTYFVTIVETLKKRVEVKANSEEEAIEKVENAYNKCDIILDEMDFTGVKFKKKKKIKNENNKK